ncbi:hypothetical protein QP400_02745 [Winkia sp. UMB3158]|uniref:hypothetical protein n=1 Tax=Winkia TaxID=2692118 RepID=UPI0008A54616|nr:MULTISPECIES: hypothetical protein [Winkia]MDK8340501.1 hypothetical protein [Winkia sp. UMB3164B]OFT40303.1 hypothetical protein HMPREF3163_01055 [Actinomyces sp. HMSC08A01]PLB80054.1 hypothetical protein CYJ21_05080 [Actinomyces sp. UMB0138]MDK6240595.1 hypothetical protein [Winkia sp. UMB10116]MDK7149051.1 hypothetical protein [Winkia sp. UMB3158]
MNMNRELLFYLIVGGAIGFGALYYTVKRYRKLGPRDRLSCICLIALGFSVMMRGYVGIKAGLFYIAIIIVWLGCQIYLRKKEDGQMRAKANASGAGGKENKSD